MQYFTPLIIYHILGLQAERAQAAKVHQQYYHQALSLTCLLVKQWHGLCINAMCYLKMRPVHNVQGGETSEHEAGGSDDDFNDFGSDGPSEVMLQAVSGHVEHASNKHLV